MEHLQLIVLFSGKRKSGKDFICEKLQVLIGGDNCCIVRISEPLKRLYAIDHKLELCELMSDGPYKEQYRLDMINWSDNVRKKDAGYFCRAACNAAPLTKVWIVSDIRRKSDIRWFRENYKNTKIVRIFADLTVRQARGWAYKEGVDNAISECDLDDFNSWDIEMANNNEEDCQEIVECVLKIVAPYI